MRTSDPRAILGHGKPISNRQAVCSPSWDAGLFGVTGPGGRGEPLKCKSGVTHCHPTSNSRGTWRRDGYSWRVFAWMTIRWYLPNSLCPRVNKTSLRVRNGVVPSAMMIASEGCSAGCPLATRTALSVLRAS